MKAILGAVVAIAIIIAVWRLWPRDSSPASDPPATGKAVATDHESSATPAPADRAHPATSAHVTKLQSAEERKRVAERIAAAHASRTAASATTPAPKLPDQPASLSKQSIKDAMHEVNQELTACYEAALPTLARKNFGVTAEMTMTGDPDVGTLIDAKQLVDDQGKPIDAKLDDCLRNTFQNLELPPLAEGDEVSVKYPFYFATGDD